MSLTLHLGVLVQPYRSWDLNARGTRRKRGAVTALTTGDVAHILEDKYGIMGAFFRVHNRDVMSAIESSLQNATAAIFTGEPPDSFDPLGSATQKIQQEMQDFVLSREAEQVGIPGTPTMAAQRGVNHLLLHPYAKSNPRRPSFHDTGLYVSSMRAWTTST